MPIVNENDTTATDEIGFGDNDVLAAQVAIMLRADLLLLLTDRDGLYSSDPRRDAGGGARSLSSPCGTIWRGGVGGARRGVAPAA